MPKNNAESKATGGLEVNNRTRRYKNMTDIKLKTALSIRADRKFMPNALKNIERVQKSTGKGL